MRRRIKDGTLAAAVLPDGTIDVDIADALLAGEAPEGRLVAVDLQEARRRKLLATCLLLADELIDMDSSMISTAQVATVLDWDAKTIAGRLQGIAEASKKLAGMLAAPAAQALEDEVNRAMVDLSSRKSPWTSRKRPEAPLQLDQWFADMNATDLLAWRTEAEAILLKMRRDLKTGKAMRIADVVSRIGQRNASVRAKLFGLPGTLAPHFALAKSGAAAKRIVMDELTDVLAELKPTKGAGNVKRRA